VIGGIGLATGNQDQTLIEAAARVSRCAKDREVLSTLHPPETSERLECCKRGVEEIDSGTGKRLGMDHKDNFIMP
jgi:hypothetical protein